MRRPWVTLVEPALPERQFRSLARAIAALGTERLRSSYQTTFWFPLDEAPSSIVEEAVLRLRPQLPRAVLRRVCGVQWWLSRMYTSHVQVDFHVDRDNARFELTGRTATPETSSVLYLNRARGGLLAVTREPANPRNPALAPDVHDFDFVAPAPNRFAFFPGTCTHGVLDAENRIPWRRLAREERLRLAIAINWWRRAPLDVPRFSESPHYRSLALAARPSL